MPTKIRNIIFIIICVCAFSITFIYQGAKVTHVLPESFNNGKYSYLEAAKLQTRPEVSLENIKKGTFQTQTEKWLTTKVPKRDSVMLFNAKVQRGVIKTANFVTGFEVYPSFFGSSINYSESEDALYVTLPKQSSEQLRRYENAGTALNNFANKYESLSVNVGIPDQSKFSLWNPTMNLVNDPLNHEYTNKHFVDNLSEQVRYVDLYYSDAKSWHESVFRTDHHWNIEGAVDAYNSFMQSCFPDLEQVEFNDKIEYDEPDLYGPYTRGALMKVQIPEKMTDYVVDLSDVSIKINDKEKTWEDIEHLETYRQNNYSKHLLTGRYEEYFHGNQAKIEFISQNNTNRNLLLIGESFLNCCERFYACSFDKVIHVDPDKYKESLEQLIEDSKITDVIVLEDNTRYCSDSSIENLIKLLES